MPKYKKTKDKIPCRICKKLLIKRYISSHYKIKHKDDNYNKFISRGFTYNIFNNKKVLFINENDFYCL